MLTRLNVLFFATSRNTYYGFLCPMVLQGPVGVQNSLKQSNCCAAEVLNVTRQLPEPHLPPKATHERFGNSR